MPGVLDLLRSALTNLAAPGKDALAAMPDGCVKADELALDLDDVLEAGLNCSGITNSQRTAARYVDSLLSSMSGEENKHLWTDEAVLNDPAWDRVRQAAREALESYGWEVSPDGPG